MRKFPLNDHLERKTFGAPVPSRFGVVPLMQIVISIVVLGFSFYVIVTDRFGPDEKHCAFGSVGTVLGFWLGGGKQLE